MLLSIVSTKATVKEVQMVEEDIEMLEDVGRNPEAKVIEELVRCELDEPGSDRFFLIGSDLKECERTELVQLLKANIEAFAWTPYEIPRIDPAFIKHELNVQLFDSKFSPRVAIKGQVLADFVAKFSPRAGVPEQNQMKPPRAEDHNLQDAPSELQPLNGSTEVDLGSPKGNGTIESEDPPEGAEIILEPPQVDPSLAWRMHVDGAKNSQGAVTSKFEAWGIKIVKYLRMAKSLISEFRAVNIEQVGRKLDAHADALVALASVFEGEIGRTVAVDVVSVLSIEEAQNSFCFVEDVLYEIHEGICGLHSGGRSLAHRTLSQGYWWPYMQKDAQVESTNKTIMNGIKKRLEKAKGKWVNELASVLWAYRTTPRKATNETPYSLAFGFEAVITLEVGLPIIRTGAYDATHNNEVLARDLDLAEERMDNALIRMADYQKQLAKSFNQKVQRREFAMGDLVLRKVIGNTKDPTKGKLGPNWEGPYKIVKLAGRGSYYSEDAEGNEIPRP
ncbi:hypothetical protein Acr_07g0011360 [Actinidia rufa]|uniref:Uncharacterized protein n=1 Tax=Actinidia rufa TaxID=165716 RepID=A0A7J0EX22_9ERIC|nr:hypothetical protein Acr_07g0011360 [Actinidia rufa]